MRILPKVCYCVISILHPNICFFLFENRLFQSLFKCISRTVLRNHLTFKISLETAFSYSKVAGETMYKRLCVSGNQEVHWDSGGSQHFQSSWDKILPLLFEVNKIDYFSFQKAPCELFLLGFENASIHKLSGKQDKGDTKPSGRQFADRTWAHWRKGLPSYFTWSWQVNHLHIFREISRLWLTSCLPLSLAQNTLLKWKKKG